MTCRTPANHPSYDQNAQTVTVVGRAMIDSSCRGTCDFSYDHTTSPTMDDLSNGYYSIGQSVTFSGAGLESNSVEPKVMIGDISATVTASSPTSCTFTYPSLPYGKHPLRVYVDGIGYATTPNFINTNFIVTPNSISSST